MKIRGRASACLRSCCLLPTPYFLFLLLVATAAHTANHAALAGMWRLMSAELWTNMRYAFFHGEDGKVSVHEAR